MTALLAFDTATERMIVAVARRGCLRSETHAGGAKASATLIATILRLLSESELALSDLDAIAFGRGPGAFTGLRAACSVAQGLAFGAGKPVLPIDSLLVVAEDARAGASELRVWAAIDARMDQIYAAEYAFADDRWRLIQAPMLTDCDALSARWRQEPASAVAGDALGIFAARLQTGESIRYPDARASAAALMATAQRAWRDGAAVDPAQALPLYVRDKVAETTLEREAKR
ncbi:MAG: tRNA (adenosine(37)-N6)-threonylcarbamoyltransferase complex dimerization subunit type 1 TsaB [Pseudomonadota bacterium]|nr:tRNA (adenosine(37)-N6)-threonylcarbamoyltransferase complex dimerization subunit type 1 TsaB [Pseudomonadota bacterium]